VNCTETTCAYGRICVPSIGPLEAPLAFVPEAPGFRETEEMEPMVGPAGKLFNKFLSLVGLDRLAVRIANTCGCVDMQRDDRRPMPAEIISCRPRLLMDIAKVRAIVSMGNISQQLFFPGMSVSKARGNIRSWKHPNGRTIPVVATYRPAYALPHRSPEVGTLIVEDIKTALSMAMRNDNG
jgi:uracil-DNA glycosylase